MKKTLVIMGTHPNGFKTFDWTREDCDIWMFNEAVTAKNESRKPLYPKQPNAVFQLHHEAIWKNPKNRNDKNHYRWLKSNKTTTLYMQEYYVDIPKSIKYPIESVLNLTNNIRMIINGKEKEFKYFTSSPDYAFGLVAEMWKQGKKYDQVEVHGIELEMESEYRYQRIGFGFWIGYLAALGIKVDLYNSIFDSPIYGYEGDVELPSKEIERRIIDLTAEMGDDKTRYNEEAKKFLESISGLLYEDVSAVVQKDLSELTKRSEGAGMLSGKIRESERYLEKARAMEKKSGVSVFSVGEFDGSRISFNKQYMEVRVEAFNLNAQIDLHLKNLLNLKKGSKKRQKAVDEFGNMVAELMNKNILMLHIVGAIKENQYYIDSFKASFKNMGGER